MLVELLLPLSKCQWPLQSTAWHPVHQKRVYYEPFNVPEKETILLRNHLARRKLLLFARFIDLIEIRYSAQRHWLRLENFFVWNLDDRMEATDTESFRIKYCHHPSNFGGNRTRTFMRENIYSYNMFPLFQDFNKCLILALRLSTSIMLHENASTRCRQNAGSEL